MLPDIASGRHNTPVLEYFRMMDAINLPCGDPEIKVTGKPLLIGSKQGCHVPKGTVWSQG